MNIKLLRSQNNKYEVAFKKLRKNKDNNFSSNNRLHTIKLYPRTSAVFWEGKKGY